MPEKFENDYTKEIERLREDKRVLLGACKEALASALTYRWDFPTIVGLTRHKAYRAYRQLLAAIAQAERPVK